MFQMLRRRRSRRGTSVLELCFCWLLLFTFTVGLLKLGSYYWGATTLSTTADVASLSAQSAYDRVRFGAGVLGSGEQQNLSYARQLSEQAANVVVNGAGSTGKGAFNFSGKSCSGGTGAPGSPIRRTVSTGEYFDGATGYDVHSFQIRLEAPIGLDGSCEAVTSVISSARPGR